MIGNQIPRMTSHLNICNNISFNTQKLVLSFKKLMFAKKGNNAFYFNLMRIFVFIREWWQDAHPYMEEISMVTSIISQQSSYVAISTGDESVAIYILLATSNRNAFSTFEPYNKLLVLINFADLDTDKLKPVICESNNSLQLLK